MCNIDSSFKYFNSDSTPFYLTQIDHREGHPDHFSMDFDLDPPKVLASNRIYPDLPEVVQVQGLLHLKHLLRRMDRNTVFRLGLPTSSPQAESQIERSGDPYECLIDEILGSKSSEYCYTCDHPALMCFKLTGVDCLEEAWELLCGIDPQLDEVGYLSVPIEDQYETFHFYCIADIGSNIGFYSQQFMYKAVNGCGIDFAVTDDGEIDAVSVVLPTGFSPDHLIHWMTFFPSTSQLGDPNFLQVRPGYILETGLIEDVTQEEIEKVEDELSNAFENVCRG